MDHPKRNYMQVLNGYKKHLMSHLFIILLWIIFLATVCNAKICSWKNLWNEINKFVSNLKSDWQLIWNLNIYTITIYISPKMDKDQGKYRIWHSLQL